MVNALKTVLKIIKKAIVELHKVNVYYCNAQNNVKLPQLTNNGLIHQTMVMVMEAGMIYNNLLLKIQMLMIIN